MNGLQVANDGRVTKIGAAVDAGALRASWDELPDDPHDLLAAFREAPRVLRAVLAARVVGLDVAGIEIVTEDIGFSRWIALFPDAKSRENSA